MKIKLYIIWGLLLAGCSTIMAQTPSQADSAYAAGDYSKALKIYENIAESDGTSPELLFNLGNAAYKEGDYGVAMLAYERAHKLDPGNTRISNNLKYLRSRIDDNNRADLKGKKHKVTADDLSFFESIHHKVAKETQSDFWAVYAALSFILLILSMALYVFARQVVARKVGFFSSMAFFVFTALFLTFAFMAASSFNHHDDAVIMAYKTELLSEPDPGAKPSTTPLNRGTMVRVLDREVAPNGTPEWYKVRLNSDFIGWIKAEGIELI